MKRNPPNLEEVEAHKKLKTNAVRRHFLRHTQDGWKFTFDCPQDTSVVDFTHDESERHEYPLQDGWVISDALQRALCIALYDAGFDGATPQALQSFSIHVQEYMIRLASKSNQSMQICRRSRPLPQDFASALRQSKVTTTQLKPYLKSETAAKLLQPTIRAPATPEVEPPALNTIFSTAADHSQGSSIRPYIPQHFPSLPSRHTYRDTAVYNERETDARQIRERATQEGVLAEQALRRLMAAKKADARADLEKAKRHGRSSQWEKSEQMWRETMEALLKEDKRAASEENDLGLNMDGANDKAHEAEIDVDIDFGTIVNYDRVHWRHAAKGDTLTT